MDKVAEQLARSKSLSNNTACGAAVDTEENV